MISQQTRERNLGNLEIQYTYIAIRPLDAEQPVGSGRVVHYDPGDIVPASDWGAAAASLLEMGRIERLAVNVDSHGVNEPSATQPHPPKPDEPEFPAHVGAGWYVLSNGTRIRGKVDAHTQQDELSANGN